VEKKPEDEKTIERNNQTLEIKKLLQETIERNLKILEDLNKERKASTDKIKIILETIPKYTIEKKIEIIKEIDRLIKRELKQTHGYIGIQKEWNKVEIHISNQVEKMKKVIGGIS